MSARQEKLKTRLFEVEYHDPGVWHFQDVNILDVWPHIADEPMVVRKGHAQRYIGEYLPVEINPTNSLSACRTRTASAGEACSLFTTPARKANKPPATN